MKIIIQGTKEEIKKAELALKEQFTSCENKATVKTEDDYTAIIDAYSRRSGNNVDGFSDEEVEKAVAICSNAIRNCAICPYRKEEDCEKSLIIDYSVLVNRKIREQCQKN